MGNALLRNYNIDKTPFSQGGFKDFWDIYHGSRKDRPQDVCIFIHEKKNLDKFTKEEKEEILNVLRKEPANLAKFKHPLVLSLVDPLLEDKTTLIFVTETFNFTLSKFTENPDTSKLEIKLLILELCNVINFMHNDAKVILQSITPENILITSNGNLKLSGLAFNITDPSIEGAESNLNKHFPNAMPLLKFVAPEIIKENKASYKSDIFALGLLIFYLYKLNDNDNSSNNELIQVNLCKNTIDNYKSSFEEFDKKVSKINFLDEEVNNIIKRATIKDINSRPDINELMRLNFFNDPKLKAFRFIDNLETNDPIKNSEFLNKFSEILNIFELKIIEKRFLPCFIKGLKNESLIVSILPIIFNICQIPGNKIDFEVSIWPSLKHVFAMKQIPAAALYFILSKINLIADKISNSEFSANMLNIICKALDCGVPKIQGIVMENLEFIIKKIDSLAFKNQVFPRLVQIVLNTNSGTLKVTILKSFIKIYNLLDQNIINENLLSTLEKLRKTDNSAEISVALFRIYEEIAKVVSVEVKIFYFHYYYLVTKLYQFIYFN
jgi:SCY1-like protein 2